MRTLTVTEARSNLYKLLDQVAENHEPILITGKRSNAVLVSEADWRAIEETIVQGALYALREGYASLDD